MPYNHGFERKKFFARQRRLRQQYERAGMTEAEILAMYQFDLAAFKNERRHREHTQQEAPEVFMMLASTADDEHPRLWWIEEIDNPVLAVLLKALPEADLELLTLYAIDAYSYAEIAAFKGATRQAVSQKIKRLLKILKNLD